MKYDIEIPKTSLRAIFRLLLILLGLTGLAMLGYKNSPVGENGRPRLLSPRLAEVTRYQHSARRWMGELQEIHSGLEDLLENQTMDLLSQDGQANALYGRLTNLQAEVDGTTVPPTLEVLHDAIQVALNQYSLAASLTITWISEPIQDNHTSALNALSEASDALDRVYQNPWMQEEP
jgi:hypothetical protein